MVRKGEIACSKQFLLFSQCFPQLYIFSQNAALCGNGLNNQDTFRFIIPLQNECFMGYTGICMSVCISVYKKLVSIKALAGLLTHIN